MAPLKTHLNQQLKSLGLSEHEIASLSCGQDLHLAHTLIERPVGYYSVPLALGPTLVVNGRSYSIPLATEETSVVAALYKTARWAQTQRAIITSQNHNHAALGQIQIPCVGHPERLRGIVTDRSPLWIHEANTHIAHTLVRRGGGVQRIEVRMLQRPDGKTMGVIHVYVQVGDSMGANRINQICEFLKPIIASHTEEKVGLCIVSNLSDQHVTQASIVIPQVDVDVGQAIQEASLFAQLDPYRAVTHNKGILNGIDALAVATGNDWRAVEAALHGYASRTGHYRGLSTWSYEEGALTGYFEGPIPVGIVGGVTHIHPVARVCLKILNVQCADELRHVMAAVGLLQNLGALKALVTGGIVAGHMRLHIKNLMAMTDGTLEESSLLTRHLHHILENKKHVSVSDAQAFLQKLRTP